MRLAITNVTVVPMDGDRAVPAQTVVVSDGVIENVAAAASISVDSMDRTIDGTGLYLVPGLADMHVHFWDPDEATLFLANGVTTVRNMWGSPFHLDWQRRVAAREVAGPRVITTSPIVDGVGPNGAPVWAGSQALTDPLAAAKLVEGYAEQGYTQVKGYSLLRPDVLRAIGDASRTVGLRLTGHCPASVTFEDAIAAGQTCFEHLTSVENGHLYEGSARPAPRAFRPETLDLGAIRALARRMADHDVWNCVTSVVWYGIAQPDLDAAFANPRLRYLAPGRVAGWDPKTDFRFRAIMDWDAYVRAKLAVNDALLRCVSILHEEGAPILAGTDTPNPFVVPGFSLHDELANLVRCGLSPYEAIRCATVEAARFVGESDWGSIARGKRADLLLVEGNPLADVAALANLRAVVVNGFVFDRVQLHESLERIAERNARPITTPDLGEDPPGEVTLRGAFRTRGRIVESCCAFRHTALPDGDLRIDESLATLRGSRTPPRRTRLVLAPDCSVRDAELRVWARDGSEGWITMRRSESGYHVRRHMAGGEDSEWDLQTEPLLPGAGMPTSALVLLADRTDTGALPTIEQGGNIGSVEVSQSGEERVLRFATGEVRLRLNQDGTFDADETSPYGVHRIEAVRDE